MAHISTTERVPDAAKRLGISVRELYELIDRGAVPAIKVAGGHLEVPTSAQLTET